MPESDRDIDARAWLAIVLACTGGVVDAISFLTLSHLFTAHMSGNSAALGSYLGLGDWHDAVHRLTPIPCFVVGVGLGTALIEIAERRGVRSALSVALGLEALLLLTFRLYGTYDFHVDAIHTTIAWHYGLLVALLAVPMGLQTAALQRVGGITVHTTFITAMLTNLGREGVAYFFWQFDRRRGGNAAAAEGIIPARPSFFRTILMGGTWVAFIGGAIIGGLLIGHFKLNAMIVPLVILALLIAYDQWRPLYSPANATSSQQGGGS